MCIIVKFFLYLKFFYVISAKNSKKKERDFNYYLDITFNY